jgi:uncharacterized membrane protein
VRVADRWRGPIKDALVTLGRAPLAFYVAHFYLIHLGAILLGVSAGLCSRAVLDSVSVLSERATVSACSACTRSGSRLC